MPHRVSDGSPAAPGRVSRMATWSRFTGAATASASSPSPARMWQAWRMILRASEMAARLPSLRSLTAA